VEVLAKKKPQKQRAYREGQPARKAFENTMKALFKAPKNKESEKGKD
jgi:hypothetical protein